METRCYTNKQYSRKECLEVSSIPANFAYDRLESKLSEILQKIEVLIDPSLFEDCHHLPFKGLPKQSRHKIKWL